MKTNLWTIYELILLQEPHHQQPTYLFNITSVFLTFSNDKNFFLNQAHEKHYVSCLDACKVEGVEILIRKKCPSFIAANIMNDTGLGYAYSGWALEEGEFDYLLKNHKPLGIEFNLIVAPEFQHNYTNLQWQRSIAAQILKV